MEHVSVQMLGIGLNRFAAFQKNDANSIASVQVTLTNSIGQSTTQTAQ